MRYETSWTYHADDDDVDCIVRVEVSPATKGRTYGDPDDCYPPEPAEVDVLRVWEDARGRKGKERDDLIQVAQDSDELYFQILDELAMREERGDD